MIGFGDSASAQAYELEVAKAKAAQKVRFAVAPRHRLVLGSKQLQAGDEVRLADVASTPQQSAHAVMQGLIRQRLVIEADHIPQPIKGGAVAVVAAGKSITSNRGILAAGDEISKNDFDAPTLQRLIERGLVVAK